MLKIFEAPELEVVKFEAEDVIATSNTQGPSTGPGGLPIIPGV